MNDTSLAFSGVFFYAGCAGFTCGQSGASAQYATPPPRAL